MALPKIEEKRRWPRYPLVRLAKFRPAEGGPPADCRTFDISGGGVRLSSFFGKVIPDEFVLTFPRAGPSYDGKYKVVWRNGSEVGAVYMGPAAPDA